MIRQVVVNLTPGGKGSSVCVDGDRVANVRSVTVHGGVGEATSVTLELVQVAVTVNAELDDTDELAEVEYRPKIDVTCFGDTFRKYEVVDRSALIDQMNRRGGQPGWGAA